MTLLEKFVMVKFEKDAMIVPKETAWFGFYNSDGDIVPLEEQDCYKQDCIGLKTLNDQKKLHFETFAGDHVLLI
jgi:palmitoyl-protein thioesterase